MFTSRSTSVLLAVIQVAYSRYADQSVFPNVPQTCWGEPPGSNIFECCPIKPVFNIQELKDCGLNTNQHPALWHRNCDVRLCTFKKKGIINDDDTINYEAVGPFMDTWAGNQTHITEALAIAKEMCIGKEGGPPIPQRPFAEVTTESCEIDKLMSCLRTNILWNCKLREDLSQCQILGDHMAKCKQYLFSETPQS